MDDHDDAADREADNALGRIARTLGVPAASFFATEPSRPSSGEEEVACDEGITQALTMMRLFLRLKDPEARARCISFLTEELLHDR